MKKKLLSMLLISAMCLSTAGDTVLAASADFELDVQAENEDFLTGSVELTDGTDEDSEVSEPGAPDDGNSGEDAGLGDVDKGHAGKVLLILIDRGDIALRAGVILEIGQRHIGVSRAEAVREQ